MTIECACDPEHPYAFKHCVYVKLIDLCVDICKRNKKTKLIWLGDKEKTLSYKPKSNEMVLTVHRWFSSTSCPGAWMMEHMDDLARKVTAKLNVVYKIQFGCFKKRDNAQRLVKVLAERGYQCSVVKDSGYYCVRYGKYKSKSAAEKSNKELTKEGYKTIIVVG